MYRCTGIKYNDLDLILQGFILNLSYSGQPLTTPVAIASQSGSVAVMPGTYTVSWQ